MDYWQNGFLSGFEDLLFNVSSQALSNLFIFMMVAIVALEMSRRITRFGTPLAVLLIVGTALYVTGALDLIAL